jgi:hypothetical protein
VKIPPVPLSLGECGRCFEEKADAYAPASLVTWKVLGGFALSKR